MEAEANMIFRRYGTSYQSVAMDFDAKALNEVGFRRDREHTLPVEEFESSYEVVETVELAEQADGPVQYETEQEMLDKLQARVMELQARLEEGGVLVVENGKGHDYPKPRQKTKSIIEDGENRPYFEYTMAPPLRISLRRPRS